jgi:hypothetical protein
MTVSLSPFINGSIGKAGEDGYMLFKKLIERLFRSGKRSHVSTALELKDPEAHITIILQPNLPDEAYQKIMALDLENTQAGEVRLLWWNPEDHDSTPPWPRTKSHLPPPERTIRRSELDGGWIRAWLRRIRLGSSNHGEQE